MEAGADAPNVAPSVAAFEAGVQVGRRLFKYPGHALRPSTDQSRLRDTRFADFCRFSSIFPTFLGDFTPDRLDSRSLRTLWEWKNRVLLGEYYIFNVVIPLEVESSSPRRVLLFYYLLLLCTTCSLEITKINKIKPASTPNIF